MALPMNHAFFTHQTSVLQPYTYNYAFNTLRE